MRVKIFVLVLLAILLIISAFCARIILQTQKTNKPDIMVMNPKNVISLPSPNFQGKISVEEALKKRRSVRSYKKEPLTLNEASQILWSAQGITDPSFGGRTAPSAGALYPLEIYLITKNVENLPQGVFKYRPETHSLLKIFEGDILKELANAALGQSFIAEAPMVLVISGVFERTTKKYGERGVQYVFMEAGHSAQNVYLQAESLNLGTVTIGAFVDEKVKEILRMPEEEHPLYIMPVGKK